MPWKVSDAMSLRTELTALMQQEGANVAALCRRFEVSRKTAYKWLGRLKAGQGVADRSRRPHASPGRTAAACEQAVLAARSEHPCWGGRKIAAVLDRAGQVAPAASTVTAILRRHGLLSGPDSGGGEASVQGPWQRFEHPRPNDLWQMDFKGHFGLADASRCHPLTVLDDHSRFSLGVRACGDQTTATVKSELTGIFRRYGLPRRMLMDNGSPFGGLSEHGLTPLTVWLLRLDVAVSHGRPGHPQTQGKDERFHRTLKLELGQERFEDLAHSQRGLDRFRQVYNHIRPHEALDLVPPIERYQVSVREFPETLPVWAYPPGAAVRKVQQGGSLSYAGCGLRLPDALAGESVALEPTRLEGVLRVYLGRHLLGELDARDGASLRCAAAGPVADPQGDV
jgi:transposase InsO family protein